VREKKLKELKESKKEQQDRLIQVVWKLPVILVGRDSDLLLLEFHLSMISNILSFIKIKKQ
jgi:hypothetical protein